MGSEERSGPATVADGELRAVQVVFRSYDLRERLRSLCQNSGESTIILSCMGNVRATLHALLDCSLYQLFRLNIGSYCGRYCDRSSGFPAMSQATSKGSAW